MKHTHLLTLAVFSLALGSCSLLPPKEVTRTELFTPTLSTALDHTELTDMMYYGCDGQYDYFTRGSRRYKVLVSQNAVPAATRFTFDNWQTGKMYRGALKDSALEFVANKLTGTNTVVGSPAVGTPAVGTPATQPANTQAVKEALKQKATQKLNTYLQNRAAAQH